MINTRKLFFNSYPTCHFSKQKLLINTEQYLAEVIKLRINLGTHTIHQTQRRLTRFTVESQFGHWTPHPGCCYTSLTTSSGHCYDTRSRLMEIGKPVQVAMAEGVVGPPYMLTHSPLIYNQAQVRLKPEKQFQEIVTEEIYIIDSLYKYILNSTREICSNDRNIIYLHIYRAKKCSIRRFILSIFFPMQPKTRTQSLKYLQLCGHLSSSQPHYQQRSRPGRNATYKSGRRSANLIC